MEGRERGRGGSPGGQECQNEDGGGTRLWRQKPQDFAPAGWGPGEECREERVVFVLELSQRPSERRGPAGSEAATALPSEGKLFITPGRPEVFPCHSCWVTCVT